MLVVARYDAGGRLRRADGLIIADRMQRVPRLRSLLRFGPCGMNVRTLEDLARQAAPTLVRVCSRVRWIAHGGSGRLPMNRPAHFGRSRNPRPRLVTARLVGAVQSSARDRGVSSATISGRGGCPPARQDADPANESCSLATHRSRRKVVGRTTEGGPGGHDPAKRADSGFIDLVNGVITHNRGRWIYVGDLK